MVCGVWFGLPRIVFGLSRPYNQPMPWQSGSPPVDSRRTLRNPLLSKTEPPVISPRSQDGPLLKISKKAEENQEQRYVLIMYVEQKHQGNIPSILGELFFLMEYRDQSIRLASGNPFTLPKNLHFILIINQQVCRSCPLYPPPPPPPCPSTARVLRCHQHLVPGQGQK